MRLKTLTIRNLASIEDATIEFDAGPLSQASVFLISGETGSGKSTILDAICLALYNTVPRMEAASVSRGDMAAADNETRSDHVFQLLRKGTAHTQVTLSFTGLYDKEYEAHWGIRRARNKPDGRLQESQMDLTLAEIVRDGEGREVSREEIKRTRKNCAAVTESVIGLSYGQFCRTTMLAQGEFTRFIKSDGAEKSQILAKVTDRSDFFEISRTIHEICAEKNKKLEEVNREMSGIELLEDDKKEALEAEIRETDALIAGLDTRGGAVEAKLAWLGKEADLAKRVKENGEHEAALRARVGSDEFVADELRARQWFETEMVRRDLRRLRRTRKDIADKTSAIDGRKDGYARILAARDMLTRGLDQSRRREAELNAARSAYDTRRPLLERETEICKLLNTIVERQKDIKDTSKRIADRTEAIGKASAALAEEVRKSDELQAACEKAAEASEEARRRLDALDLPGVTKRLAGLSERKTSLTAFVEDIKRYVADLADADTLAEEIETARAAYRSDKDKCDSLDADLIKAAEKAELARTAYETARLTVDDFTQRLRESLTAGCECPVCRQRVDRAVSFDMTAGMEYVNSLKSKADEARESKEALAKEIAEARGVLKKSLAEIEKKEKKLGEKREILKGRLAAIADKAKELGLSFPEAEGHEAWAAKADDEIKTIDGDVAQLQRRADDAKPVQAELDACLKAEKKASKEFKTQEKSRVEVEKNVSELKTAQKSDGESLNRCAEVIDTTHTDLAAIVDAGVWGYCSPDQAETFEKLFAADCAAMRKLDSDLDAQRLVVKQSAECLEEMTKECGRIVADRPDFSEVKAVEPSDGGEADGAATLSDARKLAGELAVDVSALAKLTAEEKEVGEAVAKFHQEHPGYDDGSFDALDSVTREEAERLRDVCREVREDLRAARLMCGRLEEESRELAAVRPEISEEESTERLKAEALEIKNQQADANRRKGAAQQKLDDDRKNREKTAGLKEQADRLEGICRRWRAFDDRLGSASGDKFNRIAQSYVLSDLLDRANVYLAQLTDRYLLAGQPGTFVINLIDRLQGGAMRSVHSASGGEGFLVSLSLALALGDLGNRLSVDPLFIDEGFGSLSGVPLQHAIDLLNSLRRQLGRRVGVISHISALRESIPVQLHMVADPDTAATSIELWQNNLE